MQTCACNRIDNLGFLKKTERKRGHISLDFFRSQVRLVANMHAVCWYDNVFMGVGRFMYSR